MGCQRDRLLGDHNGPARGRRDRQRAHGASDAPASTVVCALWDGSAVTVGWVGDSRAYWIARGASTCLTVDDSWAQSQLDAGATAQLVQADPRAHVVTRWLGRDAPDAPPGVASFVPAESGRVVVCSDGLWQYMPSASRLAELVHEVADEASSIDVARALVRGRCDRAGATTSRLA